MDTEARVQEVLTRARVAADRAKRAQQAGPACLGCRHISHRLVGYPAKPEAICAHLAYADWTFDPATGAPQEKPNATIQEARAEDGLCGPEGLLFERSRRDKRMILGALALSAPGLLATADLLRRLAGY